MMLEALLGIAESIGDALQAFFERDVIGQQREDGFGGGLKTLAHRNGQSPGARRQAVVRQSVEFFQQPEGAPLVQPPGESAAHGFARFWMSDRGELRLSRQQPGPRRELFGPMKQGGGAGPPRTLVP